MPVAMLDFNHRHSFVDQMNQLIDDSLQNKHAQEPKREYLGASQLGVSCSRALQDDSPQVPRDKPVLAQTSRIFERAHALEKMAVNGLRLAGFELSPCQEKGEPWGFPIADGCIQGHGNGIIRGGLFKEGFAVEMTYPALLECKSMNAQSWKQTVEKGLSLAKPIYAGQSAVYQAYREKTIPVMAQNPALVTAVNKDTSEIDPERVAGDAGLAQSASDKAVTILRATQAGETLPRAADPKYVDCCFCDWQNHYWQDRCRKESL